MPGYSPLNSDAAPHVDSASEVRASKLLPFVQASEDNPRQRAATCINRRRVLALAMLVSLAALLTFRNGITRPLRNGSAATAMSEPAVVGLDATSQIALRKARVLAATNKYTDGVVLELSQAQFTTTLEAIKVKGGLIQAFKLNGKSILFFGGALENMDGSIFWPGPQSAWGWPPPTEIDPTPSKDYGAEYSLELDHASKSFTLTSAVSDDVNLQVSKQISMDPDSAAAILDFRMKNTGQLANKWAPWEVTRVDPNGLTFYPTGSLPPSSGTWPSLPVTEIDGVTWFNQSLSSGGKLYADAGEGWLAHTNGELVMVKCFEKIAAHAAAPGEQQIEIYDGGSYVEVEVQGAYVSIPAGGQLDWNHRWYLREMPAGAAMEPGSTQLVALARSLCHSAGDGA